MLRSGRATEAKALLQKVCKLNKKDAEAWMLLGCVHGTLSSPSDAITCLNKAIKLQPAMAEAHSNLGIVLKTAGKLPDAVSSYQQAIRLKPDNASFHSNLGNVLAEQGKLDEAITSLQRAISLRPDSADIYYNLGNILKTRGSLEQATHAYQKALELRPGIEQVQISLGNSLISLGRLQDAMGYYDTILATQPASLDALCGKVRVLDKRGEFMAAFELVRPHLEAKTLHAALAVTFAEMAHHHNKQEEAIAWLVHLLDEGGWSSQEQIRLYFALGKLYDMSANYNAAFEQFQIGHSLYTVNFTIEQYAALIDTLITTFNTHSLRSLPRATQDTSLPIFIIGMPRSGTSLVEQILASHPLVTGGGEREEVYDLAASIPDKTKTGGHYPAGIDALTQEQVNSLTTEYLQRLRAVSPDALRITDKMPHNFMYLGLIQRLFPKARVIHCIRDPLDTCLSCYFQTFSGYHPYTHDLSTLGKYYREYTRLMQHWERVLEIPMMNVHYEELVSNQESVSRAIVEFCSLEWDDACLQFHKNQRAITTASYDQVRQPIYTKSINRWKNYEKQLDPLITALGDS